MNTLEEQRSLFIPSSLPSFDTSRNIMFSFTIGCWMAFLFYTHPSILSSVVVYIYVLCSFLISTLRHLLKKSEAFVGHVLLNVVEISVVLYCINMYLGLWLHWRGVVYNPLRGCVTPFMLILELTRVLLKKKIIKNNMLAI